MLTFEREAAEAKENRRRLVRAMFLGIGLLVFAIGGTIVVRASIPDAFWDFQRRWMEARQKHERDMLEILIPGPSPPEGGRSK